MTTSFERRKAIFFLILAAVLWSTSGIVVKSLGWSPLAVLGGRSIFSSMVFLIYLRRIPRRFSRWQVAAAVAYVMTQFFYISALGMTTAANAIFLQYTAPVYIILMGFWFLHEKPSRADWVSLLVIFVGLVMFFGDRLSLEGVTGNIFAILSGVSLALMTVALRAQKDGTPGESFLLGNLFTAVFCFYFFWQQDWTVITWVKIAYLGVFQIGLASVVFSIAIKSIPALEATLIGMLEPILNPVWVFLFLGELPGPMAILGALVVLVGVVISSIAGARE